MKLKIEIEMGNDAMQTPGDVAFMLKHALQNIAQREPRYFTDNEGNFKTCATPNLYDINGNQVGHIVCRED